MTLSQLRALGYRFNVHPGLWQVSSYMTEIAPSGQIFKSSWKVIASGNTVFPDAKVLNKTRIRHPGKLTFDGGRTFTLRLVAPIKGLSDRDPTMWTHMLKNQPEIVRAFVLERLKGNI
jgi:hypothetical protein